MQSVQELSSQSKSVLTLRQLFEKAHRTLGLLREALEARQTRGAL